MELICTASIKLCTFCLIILLIFSADAARASYSHEAEARSPSTMPPSYQLMYVKNTRPYVLNHNNNIDQQFNMGSRSKKKKKKMVRNLNKKRWKARKNAVNDIGDASRAFSVMLPKGFIPPSGSSSCHHDYPNSVSFYCGDSSANKPQP
ncbi:hypothetical protein Ancab_021387 [Ancistrocladus abbreviatus]